MKIFTLYDKRNKKQCNHRGAEIRRLIETIIYFCN